jgi:hypothetical protein
MSVFKSLSTTSTLSMPSLLYTYRKQSFSKPRIAKLYRLERRQLTHLDDKDIEQK